MDLSRKKILFTDLNLKKIPSCTRTLHGPVRPVRPTCQTGWSCQTGYREPDRSDRFSIPVRPVYSGCCQFWSSTCALLFFGKDCVPKNTPLNQNCLRAMITDTSAIFVLRAIKIIGHVLLHFKLMMKQFALVSKLSSWLLVLFAWPPLVAPSFLAYLNVATFSFECEISLRDTTSAVSTLNLSSHPSHPPCCN